MRFARFRRPALILMALVAARAAASECGDWRRRTERLQAVAAAEGRLGHDKQAKEAAAELRVAEKKTQAACAPRKVGVLALPLGVLAPAPGAGSRASFDPGPDWGLQLTTLAGAPGGVTFSEVATVTAPPGRLDLDAKAAEDLGGAAVVVATDAQLTVEEPAPGRGAWRIETHGKPLVVGVDKLRACAAASSPADVGGARLPPSSCAMLLHAFPLASPQAVPERGRAALLGEWQYGDRVAFEIADELAEVPSAGLPAPRLDLALDLAAAIPGVADGKKLVVSVVGNRRTGGGALRLAEECGDDGCPEKWHDVEIWWDRAFAQPFVRRRPTESNKATGVVLDRLGKTVAGQRLAAFTGERRVITMTDADSKWRIDGVVGEVSFVPVGKSLTARPNRQLGQTAWIGGAGGAVPKLFIDRLFE